MTATNTPVDASVEAPVENKGLLSRMKEGVQGITTQARNTVGSLVVGATALTGGLVAPTAVGVATVAATENAEGANVIVNLVGLPNSTVSQPVKISGTASQTTTTTQYNSQLIYTTAQVGENTTIDRFALNLNAADIGSGGTLTFTFRLNAGTDSSTGGNNGTGIANTQYQVRQELRFGPTGGPSEMLAFLDSGVRTNNSSAGFINAEAWHADSGIQSHSIPNFTGSGIHYLDSSLFVNNSTGVNRLIDMSISYTPNIPEPSVPLLVGIAGSLGVLRRKRNDTESTNTSES